MSALRLYIVIKDVYSGNLHSDNIPHIAELLDTSTNNIYRLLRQLKALGYVKHAIGTWYHIVSWRKLDASFEVYEHTDKYGNGKKDLDGNTKFKITNRRYCYDLDKVLSKDGTKYLRTFFYATLQRKAYFQSKYIYSQRKNETAHCSETELLACPRKNFMDVSYNYVKLSTGTEYSISTLSKHLKRAVGYKLFEMHQQFEKIYFKNYRELKSFWDSTLIYDKEHWFFRKSKNPKIENQFLYYAIQYLPNRVCPLF